MSSDKQPERPSDELARKRQEFKASHPHMSVLDDAISVLWDVLTPEPLCPMPQQPLPSISSITLEQAQVISSKLDCLLSALEGMQGQKEEGGSSTRPAAKHNLLPLDVQKHLNNRKDRHPDEPITRDHEAEVYWLQAAMRIRAVQTHVNHAKLADKLSEVYGVRSRAFSYGFQKYIWLLLGQGNTAGLPWGDTVPWAKLCRAPLHPDLTAVARMWHDGHDLREILEAQGHKSERGRLNEKVFKTLRRQRLSGQH